MSAPELVEVHALTADQERDLCALYQHEWFTAGRTLEDLRVILGKADVVHGFCERGSGRLVAFARAWTDGRFRAMVHDVIVASAWRGTGLGRRLMETLLARAELATIDRVDLSCEPHNIDFYERFGFEPSPRGIVFMARRRDAAAPGVG